MDYWWRVTRYDPEKRDDRGVFKSMTWTSISDIGKEFEGRVLTFDEYLEVEDAYSDAFVRFASAAGVEHVQVRGFEYGEGLRDGQLLSIDEAAQVLRLVLREEAWCRLEAVDGSFAVHAGHDYYMFIGSEMPSDEAVEDVVESGLFVEPDFFSPYVPENG
jgi:hypothetical protein